MIALLLAMMSFTPEAVVASNLITDQYEVLVEESVVSSKTMADAIELVSYKRSYSQEELEALILNVSSISIAGFFAQHAVRHMALAAFSWVPWIYELLAHKVDFISAISWGKVITSKFDTSVSKDAQVLVAEETQGMLVFKDCIITPKATYEWDWSKTDLTHATGIAIKDVEPLINDADIFILSRGVKLELQVQPETVKYLWEKGKEVLVLQSYEAAAKYNELIGAGKRVAILLHSSC